MQKNGIREPYDLIKVPIDWLPDIIIPKVNLDGRGLFEDFKTNSLICDYETYYIDNQGFLIWEEISHAVLFSKGKPRLDRRCVMQRLKQNHQNPTIISAQLFWSDDWVDIELVSGVIKRITYNKGKRNK